MLKTNFFITATDTDAGKTFVTCGVIRAMYRQQWSVQALKPMACGREPSALNGDLAALLQAQSLDCTQVTNINLYDFAAPLAPWQAALAEGKHVQKTALVQWCEQRCQYADINLIEAVGGLMVPLNAQFHVTDWLLALQPIHTVLVVRVKLGGINHMLLSLEKLRQLKVKPSCIILNDADHCGSSMLHYHQQALQAYDATLTSTVLPHAATEDCFDVLCAKLIDAGSP